MLRSFRPASGGTTGWIETALETIVRTCGTSPANALIMKLVEPWQWITALISSEPVCAQTVCTACGRSATAAWSRVHRLWGISSGAPKFSSHTSQPSSTSRSTRLRPLGARKMLARTPAPCTSSTGPFAGVCSPRTLITLHLRPSPAVNSTTRSVCSLIEPARAGRRCRGEDSRSTPWPVNAPQLAGEQLAEARDRVHAVCRAGAERRQLTREVQRMDVQEAARHHPCTVVLLGLHMALEHAREQRRGLRPDVKAVVVADLLEAGHRQRMLLAVGEPQAI